MKLAIMQPYFFPYAGHFELIARTDQWVVFDAVKYNRRSWMNRNRILHPTQGWQYINVPVHHVEFGTPIHVVKVVDSEAALARLIGQLAHYRPHAPHYEAVTELVRTAFGRSESDRLVDLNVSALAVVCEYLGIAFHWHLCSRTVTGLEGVEHAGQWALRIAQAFGADEYVNPAGGAELFDPSEWSPANIQLSFLNPTELRYGCMPFGFEPNLSILDVLMWLSPSQVKARWQETRMESANALHAETC